MTVKLTGNFLATARCLIFEDGNGITWSFNLQTNQLTAAVNGAAAGTLLATQPTPAVSAGNVGFGTSTGTTVTTTIGGTALPALAAGFLTINIGGTNFAVPYFAI